MYVMIGTRPNVAFVLSELSKVCIENLVAAKTVLRYLQFSKDYDLEFSREKATESYPCLVIVMLHGAI